VELSTNVMWDKSGHYYLNTSFHEWNSCALMVLCGNVDFCVYQETEYKEGL
jgi:homoserine trans-succinylase